MQRYKVLEEFGPVDERWVQRWCMATGDLDTVHELKPHPALGGGMVYALGGQRVSFLSGRAAYWHAKRTLIVSDLHLGKIETMAASGVPMPDGVSMRDMQRLSTLIEATQATRVLILGDLLHAPAGITDRLVSQVAAWRGKHVCDFAIVPGNHDRKLHAVVDAWKLDVLPACVCEGAFGFVHDATVFTNDNPFALRPACEVLWSGHVHPVVSLRDGGGRMKLASYVVRSESVVLPAFSEFTGGATIDHQEIVASGGRIMMIAEGRVVEFGKAR